MNVPTVFDNFSTNAVVDGQSINLNLWDTAGQEEYDRLRLLSYPQTDVVIICYNIMNKDSLNNVSAKWILEVKEHIPNRPILLIGTQKDRRDENPGDNKPKTCTTAEGQRCADELKLEKFMETSALKDREGLKEVFDEACRQALSPPTKKKPRGPCAIL